MSNTHVLRRTNPKGEAFIGICVVCGREGLTAEQANQQCANQQSLDREKAVEFIVTGKGQS